MMVEIERPCPLCGQLTKIIIEPREAADWRRIEEIVSDKIPCSVCSVNVAGVTE